jgi:hypothetical protein
MPPSPPTVYPRGGGIYAAEPSDGVSAWARVPTLPGTLTLLGRVGTRAHADVCKTIALAAVSQQNHVIAVNQLRPLYIAKDAFDLR